jgi:hypothetical protein
VEEDGARLILADILLIFSLLKYLISIKFSVPKTIICYEQSGLSFVDFGKVSKNVRCLEGVQGWMELLHMHTSQSRRSIMVICKYMLE